MKKFTFFGIKFIDGNFKSIKILIDKGGLLVLPAAPALLNIKTDKKYHKALKNADIALFDSGYFCLLLRMFKRIKVKKFSGLKFLKQFLQSQKNNSNKILFIDPSNKDKIINKKYLKSLRLNKIIQYVAPIYNKDYTKDLNLLKIITKKNLNIL